MSMIDSLYEELILLDEIAGQLDDDSNKAIDCRRRELKAEILRREEALDNRPLGCYTSSTLTARRGD